jgi:hypothetical protein
MDLGSSRGVDLVFRFPSFPLALDLYLDLFLSPPSQFELFFFFFFDKLAKLYSNINVYR